MSKPSRVGRWNARYAEKELIWSAEPNTRFAREVTELTPGTALDVACGEGRNALWLAAHGWQTTAVDFSDVAIGKATRIAQHRGVKIDWIVADVAATSLPTLRFDLVAVLFLHTDPEERSRWLPNVIDAVRPGGTFIYMGHDPSNIARGTGGPQDARLLPTAEAVTAALDGFCVITASVIERPVVAEPGHGEKLAAGTGNSLAYDTFVRAVRHGTPCATS